MSREQRQHYQPDEIDWQIVDALRDFGRRSNTELASQLGLNETTIRKRIARLLSEGLMNIVAVPNPVRMGYNVVAVIGVTAMVGHTEDIVEALAKMPRLRYAGLTTGSFDFILEAWFTSNEELQRFLAQDLGRVPGIIRTETFHVIKLIKHLSDWGVPDRVAESDRKQNEVDVIGAGE